jgi:redox-sensitive bicupin YhaK (pirin superfamily)
MVMTSETLACRPVRQIVTAHRQREGAGFIVRRPFPTQGLDHVDPFLMLDEVGPIDYGPGEALGAPDHPHRGFETVSYILEGEKLHEDSTGFSQLLSPGDVQWMTAGSGIVHSEMPSPDMQRLGGRAHGFQIWVNLPAERKMVAPRYQHVPADDIPLGTSTDGRIEARVIAGEAFGTRAAIDTYTPIILQNWTVRPRGRATQPLPADHQAAVYVFDGEVAAGEAENIVAAGQLAILGNGDSVAVAAAPAATVPARFLLLAGVPLGEPIARYGPFVMTTPAEIEQAIDDYRMGRMGVITR